MMEDQFYDQQKVMKDHHQTLVLKGKRTRRQRPMTTTTTTTTSSCSSGAGDGGFCDLNLSFDVGVGGDHVTISPSNYSGADEEDTANILILLAQGRRHHHHHATKSVQDVYECKTCNRQFHSFQALGGHRASHRKPKLVMSENSQLDKFSNTSLSLQVYRGKELCSTTNNNKSRVHECLICGAEFNSGQALGGHMRRHRPVPVTWAAGASTSNTHDDYQEVKKSKLELLGLDLNLPAPEDDHYRESKLSFASKDQVPVFATSQLIHCNY